METRYVPVRRAMAGVQGWLRARLGDEPLFKSDRREAYWLPDGRVIPDYDDIKPMERHYALPVRAVVLEYD